MKRLLAVYFLLCTVLLSQVGVNSPISSFNQVMSSTGTSLTDFVADQRTGQGQDDFVVNGFYKAINYSLTNPEIIYRFRFDKYDSKGFVGNLRIGLDVNGDNAIDLFYGVSNNGSTGQIIFQLPTSTAAGANTAPSNTSLGTMFNSVSTTATNYSYLQVDSTTNDAWLTFALTYNDIFNAIGGNIQTTTQVHEIAFTSTNTNGINQDIYGVNGGTTISTTFFNSGAFTDYRDFNGKIAITPEPSTYGAIFTGVALGIVYLRKRKKQ